MMTSWDLWADFKAPDESWHGYLAQPAEGVLGRHLVCDASSFSLAAEYLPAMQHACCIRQTKISS